MRIIVTGSAGFIGKYLVEYYEQKGAEVYGWTRKGVFVGDKNIYPVGLVDTEGVKQVISCLKPDVVFHCAGNANVSKSIENPYDDFVSNVVTTENLMFALASYAPKCKAIFLSSAAVYGNPVSLPMDESQPINPLSPYALHKYAAENVCVFMKKNHGLDIKIARIFSVYGPGLKKQIFWDMYQKIKRTGKLELWGSGTESRDYIYITDLVNTLDLLSKDKSEQIIFNVANGIEITIRTLAECFAKSMNVSVEKIIFNGAVREGDPINWCADISGLKKIGYHKDVDLKAGIEKYISWVNLMY